MEKPRDGSELSGKGNWDLPMSENSGREAWERKWDEKVPGKVASLSGIFLVAKSEVSTFESLASTVGTELPSFAV